MLSLLLRREEDDYQFHRNLHLLATQASRSNQNDSKLWSDLIEELSFWNGGSLNVGLDEIKEKRELRSSLKVEEDSMVENTEPQNLKSTATPVWKTAVDPVTGRTYYYDAITRQTQWHKPPEVRALEKKKKEERRKRDAVFFKEMEANIMESLKRGELIPGIPNATRSDAVVNVGPPREPRSPPENKLAVHRKAVSPHIRTISGMDEVLLAELKDDNIVRSFHAQRPIEHRSGRPPLPAGPSKPALDDDDCDSDPLELSPDPAHPSKDVHSLRRNVSSGSLVDSDLLAGESLLDEPIQCENDMIAELTNGDVRPLHTRRNTGGTIYLQNTIYNPDIQATIKCVCGVYRTHIVQAAEEQALRSPVSVVESTADLDVRVFHDPYTRNPPSVPTLAEVLALYEEFYQRSQMEQDTIIMSLIYVERLVKSTNGVLSPSPENWRSILFSCMVLASKVWDDLSMWNSDFSNVSAATAGLSSFTLPRINQLELALLKALNFDVRVPASEYAKYYFLIRTMLLRSGLVQEGSKPLQRDAFSKLESLTTQYQNKTVARPEMIRYRVHSLDGVMTWLNAGNKAGPVIRDNVCLEQLVG